MPIIGWRPSRYNVSAAADFISLDHARRRSPPWRLSFTSFRPRSTFLPECKRQLFFSCWMGRLSQLHSKPRGSSMFATLSTQIGSGFTLICGAKEPIAALFVVVVCCQVADLHAIERSRPVASQAYRVEVSAQTSVSSACDGIATRTPPANTKSASVQFQKSSLKMVGLRRHCSSERRHSRVSTLQSNRSHRGLHRRERSIRKSVEVNRSSHGITVPPNPDNATGEQLFDPEAPPNPADFH